MAHSQALRTGIRIRDRMVRIILPVCHEKRCGDGTPKSARFPQGALSSNCPARSEGEAKGRFQREVRVRRVSGASFGHDRGHPDAAATHNRAASGLRRGQRSRGRPTAEPGRSLRADVRAGHARGAPAPARGVPGSPVRAPRPPCRRSSSSPIAPRASDIRTLHSPDNFTLTFSLDSGQGSHVITPTILRLLGASRSPFCVAQRRRLRGTK